MKMGWRIARLLATGAFGGLLSLSLSGSARGGDFDVKFILGDDVWLVPVECTPLLLVLASGGNAQPETRPMELAVSRPGVRGANVQVNSRIPVITDSTCDPRSGNHEDDLPFAEGGLFPRKDDVAEYGLPISLLGAGADRRQTAGYVTVLQAAGFDLCEEADVKCRGVADVLQRNPCGNSEVVAADIGVIYGEAGCLYPRPVPCDERLFSDPGLLVSCVNSSPTRVQRTPSEEGGTEGRNRASRPSDYAPFPVSSLGSAMLALLGLAGAIRGWNKGADWLFLTAMLALILGSAGIVIKVGLALMDGVITPVPLAYPIVGAALAIVCGWWSGRSLILGHAVGHAVGWLGGFMGAVLFLLGLANLYARVLP